MTAAAPSTPELSLRDAILSLLKPNVSLPWFVQVSYGVLTTAAGTAQMNTVGNAFLLDAAITVRSAHPAKAALL